MMNTSFRNRVLRAYDPEFARLAQEKATKEETLVWCPPVGRKMPQKEIMAAHIIPQAIDHDIFAKIFDIPVADAEIAI